MNQQKSNEELMEELIRWRDEPLRDELQDWVCEGSFGKSLKHPLVFDVPLMTPGRANRAYGYKTKALQEALDKEDWHTVIWLHERPYRCDALIDYVVGRDDEGFVIPLSACTQDQKDIAADVWVDSENINQHVTEWTEMFDGPGFLLGDEKEREEFDALDDPVILFRATIDDGDWSWTTSMKTAKFFAGRFDARFPITKAAVSKEYAFGYLTRRSENEVLVRLDAPVEIDRKIPYSEWSRNAVL